MTLNYGELPYRGIASLTLDYTDGELTFTALELLVSPTPSAGFLDVVASGLDDALAQPGLTRACLVLPSGSVLIGAVTHINRFGGSFVLCVDDPARRPA
ncbi:hypothetical protein [Pseudomonas sp. PNPG3]|uniref:hypothetical protein n=1 Tax=Pseudomonas sp. PNPG3 TaxID=2919497 RepID=UPI001FFD34FC|nr:hypothetical protein [Pseudomonas sp. PNPG3]MCK2122061.1 hypothetical protein [Pseudomonas sp. PNPG3]